MELILVVHLLVIAALAFGTVTDLKKREIPDIVSYGLVFFGLATRIIASYFAFSWDPILEGLLGFGVFFAIGALMFYTGQWGGGDSKILFGMGAAIGIPLQVPSIVNPPFMASFIVNLIIIGAFYGMLWSLVLALKNWSDFVKSLLDVVNNEQYRRYKLPVWASSILILILAFLSPLEIRIPVATIGFVIFASYYLFILVKGVEGACMYKTVNTYDLVEGDWVADPVIVNKKQLLKKGKVSQANLKKIHEYTSEMEKQWKVRRKGIFREKEVTVSLEKLQVGDVLMQAQKFFSLNLKKETKITKSVYKSISTQYYKHQFLPTTLDNGKEVYAQDLEVGNTLSQPLFLGTVLCGPHDLGIETEQIEALKLHKIPNVLVKEGIPFVPSFLIAYGTTLIIEGGHVLAFLIA